MNTKALLEGDRYESTVLRESADKLNLIWRLAYAYQAPELLRFLDDLAGVLAERREFLRTSLDAWNNKVSVRRRPVVFASAPTKLN
jgi:hypothetical protein